MGQAGKPSNDALLSRNKRNRQDEHTYTWFFFAEKISIISKVSKTN
jgi:hypothetical protein